MIYANDMYFDSKTIVLYLAMLVLQEIRVSEKYEYDLYSQQRITLKMSCNKTTLILHGLHE